MYRAPELFRNILCKKADVYGVALVMYYLICRKPMWPDASMFGKNIFEFVSADICHDFQINLNSSVNRIILSLIQTNLFILLSMQYD